MQTILIATTNNGKKKELASALKPLGMKVIGLNDLPKKLPEPAETGETYEENALIKARAAGEATGFMTVADDSGIEVEALPGQLGVQSARYARTDQERNRKLLVALRTKSNRRAQFVSCLVLYDPTNKTHHVFTGTLAGEISKTLRGAHGFGFDPLFIPQGQTKTYAELGLAIKNNISHRSIAFRKLVAHLKRNKRSDRNWLASGYLAWIQSLVATAGSLYFSEIRHFTPCVLCWYQRVFMYPLVLLIAVGILRNDRKLYTYVLPTSIVGLLIAAYHNLLYYKVLPESILPCVQGVSCTTRFFAWYGFITIPLLSLTAFTVITTIMIYHWRLDRRNTSR